MCHRCGEHRSNCICTPSKSELKRRAAQTDAPERTPLSERLKEYLTNVHVRGKHYRREMDVDFVAEVAALEQECEHQREIINGSDHLSRIAALEQERRSKRSPRTNRIWKDSLLRDTIWRWHIRTKSRNQYLGICS